MNCGVCVSCFRKVGVTKLCIPLQVPTLGGDAKVCYCVCEGCRDDFIKKTQMVLEAEDA